jgi:hypothetical protein
MEQIEQDLLPDGDTSEVRDVVNLLGRLAVTEALLRIEKLFNTLCRQHPHVLEPEWYFSITECGEALARLGKERVLPLLTNPPELADEESRHLVQMSFFEMRHLAGDSTAFDECLRFALEYPDMEYFDTALKIFPMEDYGGDGMAFIQRYLATDSCRRLAAAHVAAERKITDLEPAILHAFQAERCCCHKIWLAGCAAKFGDAEALRFLREVADGNVEEVGSQVKAAGALLEADIVDYFDYPSGYRDEIFIAPGPPDGTSIQDIVALAAGGVSVFDAAAGVPVLRELLLDEKLNKLLLFGLISQLQTVHALPLLAQAYESRCWLNCRCGLPWNQTLVVLVEGVGKHQSKEALSLLIQMYRDSKAKDRDKRETCAAAGEILRHLSNS